MILGADDGRLSFWCPQPVERTAAAVRLERFPRAVADVLRNQIGPLANLRSSSGCAVALATDSPWIELRLERLRHHQPIPQSVALEVRAEGRWLAAEGEDLRERDGDLAVRLATGLERGGPLRPCWLWLPPVSTCAVAGVALADGASVAAAELPEPAWLAIGDSLTQGFSCQSPRATMVHRLMRRWQLPAWNLGVGGIGIVPEAFAPALAARRWPLVTIALGANHAWSEATVPPVADAAARLAELALASGAGQVAWIIPGWKPCEDGKGPGEFAGVALDRATGERFARIRAALRERLAAYAGRIQLIEELTPRDHRLLPDGLHPEAWGSAVIADRLAERLAPAAAAG